MADKKYIIGNWKMQLAPAESVKQAEQLKKLLSKSRLPSEMQVAVAPDFLSWIKVAEVLRGSKIQLASQDGWWADKGAYTGEISLAMLKKLGCTYAIIGHSERRQQVNETNELINQKIKAALLYDLVPILCVGETFADRKEGRKEVVIIQQVHAALNKVDILPQQTLIIAYEPVWAIGSGQACDPQEAKHTALVIKQAMLDVLEDQDLPLVEIIYGGSVDKNNIKNYLAIPEIKGALVGGASLVADNFMELIKQA